MRTQLICKISRTESGIKSAIYIMVAVITLTASVSTATTTHHCCTTTKWLKPKVENLPMTKQQEDKKK